MYIQQQKKSEWNCLQQEYKKKTLVAQWTSAWRTVEKWCVEWMTEKRAAKRQNLASSWVSSESADVREIERERRRDTKTLKMRLRHKQNQEIYDFFFFLKAKRNLARIKRPFAFRSVFFRFIFLYIFISFDRCLVRFSSINLQIVCFMFNSSHCVEYSTDSEPIFSKRQTLCLKWHSF